MKRKGCETSRLGQLAEASTPMPRTLGASLALRQKQSTLVSMSRCVDVWGGLPDDSEARGSCPQYRVEAELVFWELTPCCRASECLDLLHPCHKCEGCAGSHWCAASTPQVLEFAGPVTAHQSQQHTRPWQSSLPPAARSAPCPTSLHFWADPVA